MTQCETHANVRSQAGPAQMLSLQFLQGYVITMRPYLLFVSGITGVAGLSLAPAIPVESALVLALTCFLSYGFGQALTDCFQLDTDSLSSPYRPLVRGEIRRQHVMAVSLSGLVTSGVIFALYNTVNLPLAVAAITGLATYTYFKRRWWGGPFYNAWIVVVLLLIGYASGIGAAGAPAQWTPALLGTVSVALFGYSNFVLTGYYKDISADRATGYRTLPVTFGLSVSTIVSDVFALLSVTGYALAVSTIGTVQGLTAGRAAALLFLAGGVVATVTAQTILHTVKHEGTAHRAIAPVVHSYILLLSAIAALHKPPWAPVLALFYVAFVITMRLRPMRQQI